MFELTYFKISGAGQEYAPPLAEAVVTGDRANGPEMDKVMDNTLRPTVQVKDVDGNPKENPDGSPMMEAGPITPHVAEVASSLDTYWKDNADNKVEYTSRVNQTGDVAIETYGMAKEIAVTVVGIAKFVQPIAERIEKWPLIGGIAKRINQIASWIVKQESTYGESAKAMDTKVEELKHRKAATYTAAADNVIQNVGIIPRAIGIQTTYTTLRNTVDSSRVGAFWRKKQEEKKQRRQTALGLQANII